MKLAIEGLILKAFQVWTKDILNEDYFETCSPPFRCNRPCYIEYLERILIIQHYSLKKGIFQNKLPRKFIENCFRISFTLEFHPYGIAPQRLQVAHLC